MSTLLDRLVPGSPGEVQEQPPSGGSLLDRLRQPTDLDRSPIGAATRDRRFNQLMQAMHMAEWARTNPEIGDPEELLKVADQYTIDLAAAYGLPVAQVRVRARNELPTYVEQQGSSLPPSRHQVLGMNVLGAIGSTFEPLQGLGDLGRTFTSNLAYVQGEREARNDWAEHGEITDPGDQRYHAGAPASNPLQALGEMFTAGLRTVDQLELDTTSGWYTYFPSLTWDGRRLYGTSPYEEDRATRGRDLVAQFHLAERFGIDEDNELAMEWLGIGLEVLMDPYMAADMMFGGAKIARVIANRTGNAAWARNATALERTSRHIYRTVSPKGMVQDLDSLASGLSLGYWDDLKTIVARGMNSVLDAPAPAWFLPARARAAIGVLGIPVEAVEQTRTMAPRWRDVFFQSGTTEWLPGPLPKWLTGGEGYGLSEAEKAMGYRNQVHAIGLRAVQDIGAALTEGLPRSPMQIRFPWARVAMPGAKPVRPELQGYVRGVNMAVRDWLDGAGMWDNVRSHSKMMERLEAISTTYNLPMEDTLRRFEQAASAGRRATVQIGYEVSGYRHYTDAMRAAAADLGYDYNDVRRAYEGVFTGTLDPTKDLQAMEAARMFPTVTKDPVTGALSTGALAPDAQAGVRAGAIWQQWANDPNAYDAWLSAVNRHLSAAGRTELHGVTPERFLQGIQEGYLRRSFMGTREPDTALARVSKHEAIPMREPNMAATVNEFRGALGDDAANAVEMFLRGMTPSTPRGQPTDAVTALTFRSEDLAQVLTQRLGKNVTPRQVSDIVYRHDPNAIYLRETMDLLEGYNVIQPDPGLGGSVYGQIPSTYQARQDLDPEHLARLIQYEDTTRQVAEMAARGGRQVQSQEFLGTAYQQLKQDGLLRMRDEIRPSRAADVTAPLTPFEVDGVRYVAFPENPSVWGPFAGHAVPESIARTMVHAMAFQATGSSAYERVLRMWRQMLISPLQTSLRNVIGNFLLIQQAGGNLSEMVTSLPRANRLRSHFLEHGRLPEPFAGYEHMFQFVQDSTRTRQAIRGTSELLEDVASGKSTFENILSGAEEFVEWGTRSPALGVATLGGTGALGLFRYGEEITRTAAFLTTYDSFINHGMAHADAMSRAAHFASNSAYNYGALPLGPGLLRRSGLSAFPQFAYFTGGRTARVIAENPAAPLRFEYLRRLVNMTSTDGDLTEQERLTLVISDWQRYGHPMVIPIPGQDGRYYAFDTQYFFPQGANILDVAYDPFTLPAIAPWIDMAYALVQGSSGTGPFSARYGLKVFDPADDFPQRLVDAAKFTVSSYAMPGVVRTAQQAQEMAEYKGLPFGVFGYTGANEEALDLWALSQLRFVNADPAQFWARRFGLNLRKVSTDIADPSFSVAVNKVQTEMGPGIASARGAWEKEMFLNGPETDAAKALEARYWELEERAWARLQQIIDLLPGGN